MIYLLIQLIIEYLNVEYYSVFVLPFLVYLKEEGQYLFVVVKLSAVWSYLMVSEHCDLWNFADLRWRSYVTLSFFFVLICVNGTKVCKVYSL